MKKSTYYFSHDYNAANDVKVLFLRQKHGMLGYGVYWYIIESLAQSNGELPIKIIPVLAMQMQVDKTIVESIIYDFGLFVPRETTFVSNRLLQHLSLRNTLKEKGKEGAAKRWGNGEANSHANAKKSKEKENEPIGKIIIR
jgi:hypothetical protein